MKTIQRLLFIFSVFTVQLSVSAQPQCIGFKADFVFQHQTTSGPLVQFTNTSTWTDSNTYYLWSYGDGQQKLIEQETHTYNSMGNYTVCLYIYKLLGGDTVCRSTTCKMVSVIGGVNDYTKLPTIQLYPNPVQNFLTINTEYNTPLQLSIKDILGRVVITESFTQQITIPTATLAQGIYYVEVKTTGGVVYREKVKK